MSDQIKKGDRYIWSGMDVEVLRVARDGSWADIKVTQPTGASWTKRQPTPIPGERVV